MITDGRTGLQWYVGPDRDTNWYDAEKWVEGLAVAGGGWRMPSRSELGGLYQKGKGSRNMDPTFKTSGWCVWSSEPHSSLKAWFFNFSFNDVYLWSRNMDFYNGAFAVRFVQKKAAPPQTKPRPKTKTTKRFTNSIGMEFVLIPAGDFMMGSPEGPGDVARKSSYEKDKPDWYKREHPRHRVKISRPFYMQTTEVTQAQWKAVMGSNLSRFKGDNLPVEQVSWNDAQEFIKKLNRKERTVKYRLPTEAEWEYACRAGTTTPFYFGETISTDQANYDGNYTYGNGGKGLSRKTTMPAKSFPANRWGLYDMHGNVWEWVSDWFGENYYSSSPFSDPKGPSTGKYRVLRGSSWRNFPGSLRSALRDRRRPADLSFEVGFRVARDF